MNLHTICYNTRTTQKKQSRRKKNWYQLSLSYIYKSMNCLSGENYLKKKKLSTNLGLCVTDRMGLSSTTTWNMCSLGVRLILSPFSKFFHSPFFSGFSFPSPFLEKNVGFTWICNQTKKQEINLYLHCMDITFNFATFTYLYEQNCKNTHYAKFWKLLRFNVSLKRPKFLQFSMSRTVPHAILDTAFLQG